MYTIKGAAERVGITASTLRAWERRYGIVEPGRTEGGYRVYSEDDVRVLTLMARLIEGGRPPSLAAQEARRQHRGADTPVGPHPVPGGDRFGERLVEAAAVLDAHRLGLVLDEMFAQGSYELVVDQHLIPALHLLGDAWAAGRITVAGEHLVANAVMRRIAASYEAASGLAGGPRILFGLAPGCRHELGLFAFAVAARRIGLATDYLGADIPVEDWVAAVRDGGAAAVVLALASAADAAPTAEVIAALRGQRPELLVAVGGGQQDLAPAGALQLGHNLAAAAGLLADAVGARVRG